MQDARRTKEQALRVSRTASAEVAALVCAIGAVAAALAVCAPAIGGVATQPAASTGEAVVRLYGTAVVTDDEVRLADVAELEGEAAKLADSWVIGNSPHVGETKVIELDAIERALSHKGANLSQWVLRGSSRCTVSRPKSCIASASQPACDSNRTTGTGDSNRVSDVRVDPSSLEALLREHIGRKTADLGGVPVIKFSPAAKKVLALTQPQYSFRITDRATQSLGMMPVEVEISEQGKVMQTLPMLVHVSVKKPIVVAARVINRSQCIDRDDVMLAERTFERIEEIGMSDASPLIGQQAKRPIDRGEQLSTKDVEPVPLVQRNDLVTVWVHRGGVSVKGAAKAMGAASYGETVALKNEASKQIFEAVVTGPRTAEVKGGEVVLADRTAKERAR